MAEGKFDLVEVLLWGDALTYWMEFKHVETMCIGKRPDGTDMSVKGAEKALLPEEFSLAPEGLSMQSRQKTKQAVD
eukprot:13406272-Ditylum_brightwellii.AAC.1